MVQYVITFFIVQMMFLAIGVFGGIEFGTSDAGALCALSQAVGVVACVMEYMCRKRLL